jgi:LmbE family N-acetylglucosaminyl deacetylase
MVSGFRPLLSRLFQNLFSRAPVLYLAPHQDDELLSMGVDICRQTHKANTEIHAALFTDGSRSNMRLRIGNGKACPLHEGIHQYQLEIPEFVAARDREFTASCLALGVKQEHIHILPVRATDGSLDPDTAEQSLRALLKICPKNTTVCTISPFGGEGQHADHRALGQAALKLYREGAIRKLRLFVEPYCLESSRKAYPNLPLAEVTADSTVRSALEKAADAYRLWAPDRGRYAVGYHSVTDAFDNFLSAPTVYIHSGDASAI